MDVTKSSYKQLLPAIKKSINNSTFLAIDCEFTGLNAGPSVNIFDTQKQYYNKLKIGAQNFIIIQFGLCAFRYDVEADVFKQTCYNFYVFPRQSNKDEPDRKFICQASSIEFLSNHNFDFNRVFCEGISYLNKEEELKCLDMLREKQTLRANRISSMQKSVLNSIPIPDEDKEFIDNSMNIIDSFISSDDTELMLSKCNPFLRKLLHQTVSEKYGPDIFLETRILENKDRALFIVKTNESNRADKEKERCEQEMIILQDAVGFATVVQYMSESGKLIIGHNALLDLIHTVDKFLTPLPDEYDDFKECINCVFPRIIDTKFMASIFPLKNVIKSSVLGHLLETVRKEPFEMPVVEIEDEAQGYKLDDEKQHEAGYDAFITGICFITMSQYIGKLEKSKSTLVLPESPLLEPFINKVYLMRLQNSPHMNLSGKDLLPPRDNVLHITFPKYWKLQDITQMFSPFGNVYVAWIDDYSAYIGFQKNNEAALALNALQQSKACTVISYARHNGLEDTNSSGSHSPRPNKKNASPAERKTTEMKKKRKSIQIEEPSKKRKFATIDEQPEEEQVFEKITNKTFLEDSTWD